MVTKQDLTRLIRRWVRVTTKTGAKYEGLCNPGTRKGRAVLLLSHTIILNRDLTVKAAPKRPLTRTFPLTSLASVIHAEK